MTGGGLTYRSRQRVRVHCPDCGENMTVGSLAVNWKTHNGVDAEGRNQWVTSPPDGEPQTYWMSFPTAAGPRECPFEECRRRVATKTSMRVNFLCRHIRENMIILEEGTPPPNHDAPGVTCTVEGFGWPTHYHRPVCQGVGS